MFVLALHFITALLWGVIVQWPFGGFALQALIGLAIVHLLAPFWFHLSNVRPFHRVFLYGPIVLAVIDAGFLYYALREEIWRDLTVVFVPILAAASVLALLWSLLIMGLLFRWRDNRETKKRDADKPPP
jgi:hypothetical protein